MAECLICGTEYEEDAIALCDHCGFDLTPYPPTVGQIPTAYLEKEQTQLESVKQMWVTFEETKQKLLKNLATQAENETKQLNALNTQLEEYKQIINELNNDNQNSNNNYLNTIQELNERINYLESEKSDLQINLKQARENILYWQNKKVGDITLKELTERINYLESEKNSFEINLKQSNNNLASLQNKIRKLQNEKDNLEKDLSNKNDVLKQEETILKKGLNQVKETINGLNNEIESLKNKNLEANRDKDYWKGSYFEFKEESNRKLDEQKKHITHQKQVGELFCYIILLTYYIGSVFIGVAYHEYVSLFNILGLVIAISLIFYLYGDDIFRNKSNILQQKINSQLPLILKWLKIVLGVLPLLFWVFWMIAVFTVEDVDNFMVEDFLFWILLFVNGMITWIIYTF